MPRNVRNFWLELSVDGSHSDIATGPRDKDGGFSLTIKQRSEGGIVQTMRINGREVDGRLILTAEAPGQAGALDGELRVETVR